jgi:hypothetical protein
MVAAREDEGTLNVKMDIMNEKGGESGNDWYG